VLSSFCAKEENENKRKIMRDKYFFICLNLEIKKYRRGLRIKNIVYSKQTYKAIF
jgi:hypothetical protein